MLSGVYKTLYELLIGQIPGERMFSDPMQTLAWGTDAGFYRLIPKLVIKAHTEDEVSTILKHCHELQIPVTFRAAGTSLSGQAISDSVLVVASDNWKKYEILDGGMKIRLQPGITGGRANIFLAPYGRKIGPDPASINAAMIGGIAANNASGMCCGTAENSYKTIHSLKLVFVDGTCLDTSDEESKESFRKTHHELLKKISTLADRIKENQELAALIRHKYKMKNTTGYSLNALVDFADPFDIINHLMIGSEGTLAFMSEITYHTVVEHAHKATSLMIFPDIEKACQAVTILKEQDVAAVEIIDRAGLHSVEDQDGMPSYLRELPDDAAALLVETRANNNEKLSENILSVKKGLEDIPLLRPLTFTSIPAEYIALWNIRKGLFPSVGAIRETGTTVIIEDVAFPVLVLAQATLDLQVLLKKYKYHEAVIFGHALDGNLHFVFTQDFSTPQEVQRYAGFMNELAEMVVTKYHGSLKAEHGTGRNMAPFVEKEWGSEAYAMMKEIKAVFDPENLLNPGVILNDNPHIHLENLKPMAPVHPVVDKCIECGFCDSVCVSTDLTLSPRQRIVVLREMERLKGNGHEPHILASLNRDFDYGGNQTCATDGLCAINCPVKIDTGEMIKTIRSEKIRPVNQRLAGFMASHTGFIVRSAAWGLSMVNFFHTLLGEKFLKAASSGLHKLSANRLPQWNRYFPKGAPRVRKDISTQDTNPKVVYFPSCINRGMGVSKDYDEKVALSEKMKILLKKAGYDIIYPEKLTGLCCGMAYYSKGYKKQGKQKSDELEKALRVASRDGEYPVLCDMSPCLFTMKSNMEPDLKLYEPIDFILQFLTDKLDFRPVDDKIAVFSVCSAKKMGLEAQLVKLAKMCSTRVVDMEANCCGFAGDRGFTYPELNAHGLRTLKEQAKDCSAGYSTSRTCEIGLSLHSDVSFQSIIYLVDRVTTPKVKSPKG